MVSQNRSARGKLKSAQKLKRKWCRQSAMSWVESAKWEHARKDNADNSSQKGEGPCQESISEKIQQGKQQQQPTIQNILEVFLKV